MTVAAIGEVREQDRSYDPGDLPAVPVSLLSVGDALCFESGCDLSAGVADAQLVNGFIPQCVLPSPPDLTKWEELSDYNSCSVQLAGARILDWSYGANSSSIFDFLAGFLGPDFALAWHPPTALLPAITTAVSSTAALAWVDGTANFQQFALQAAYSLIGPTDVGGYSTSTFWKSASDYLLSAIDADGYTAGTPIFLCGHSYGAVAATVTAARLLMANSSLRVRYMTYGMPHIGDQRLVGLLGHGTGIHLRNFDDIVTAIPPDLDVLNAVIIALGAPSLAVWPSWLKSPNGAVMDSSGSLTTDEEPLLDYPTLLAFAADVLAALPYPNVHGHAITTYYDRIFTRCSSAEWPVSDSDYAKLQAVGYILMEGTGDVLDEVSQPIFLEAE